MVGDDTRNGVGNLFTITDKLWNVMDGAQKFQIIFYDEKYNQEPSVHVLFQL